MDFKGSWEDHLPLAKFSNNHRYQASIKMAPFAALYRRKCGTLLCWDDIAERRLLGPKVVIQTVDKIEIIRR